MRVDENKYCFIQILNKLVTFYWDKLEGYPLNKKVTMQIGLSANEDGLLNLLQFSS